ncbi:MAG: hypothetical protein HY247_03320 [archaeon]|nr:MAG: hypothetical protein HY247_03320 [archaeon]
MKRRGISKGRAALAGLAVVAVVVATTAYLGYYYGLGGGPAASGDRFQSLQGKYLEYNFSSGQGGSMRWEFRFSQVSADSVNLTNKVTGLFHAGTSDNSVNATNWFVVGTDSRLVEKADVRYSGPWFLDPSSPDFINSSFFLWIPKGLGISSSVPIGFGYDTGQKSESVPIVARDTFVVAGHQCVTLRAELDRTGAFGSERWIFWYDESSGFLVKFQFGTQSLELVGGNAISNP